MPKTIPLKRDEAKSARHELTAEELIQLTQNILQLKAKAMKEQVHYGIIPGCKKPSLWKPGAKKMCAAFRLEPKFETTSREDPNRTINWQKNEWRDYFESFEAIRFSIVNDILEWIREQA